MSQDVAPGDRQSAAEWRTTLQEEADKAYIEAVRANAANGTWLWREAAQRSWTIAVVLAAVVLAAGFTDNLQDGTTPTQIAGVTALILWFLTAILFIRVNTPPRPDLAEKAKRGRVVRNRLDTLVMRAEPAEDDLYPEGSISREAQDLHVKMTAATWLVIERTRLAVFTSMLAAAATVATLVLSFATSPDPVVHKGHVLLASAARVQVLSACEAASAGKPVSNDDPLEHAQIFTSDLGDADPLARVVLAPKTCGPRSVTVYVVDKQVLGVIES